MPRSFLVKKNRVRRSSSDLEDQPHENQQKDPQENVNMLPTTSSPQEPGTEHEKPVAQTDTPSESDGNEHVTHHDPPSKDRDTPDAKTEDIEDFFERLKAQISANALASHEIFLSKQESLQKNSEITERHSKLMDEPVRQSDLPHIKNTQEANQLKNKNEERQDDVYVKDIEMEEDRRPLSYQERAQDENPRIMSSESSTRTAALQGESCSAEPTGSTVYMISRQSELRRREEFSRYPDDDPLVEGKPNSACAGKTSEERMKCKTPELHRASYGPTIDSLREQREKAFNEATQVENNNDKNPLDSHASLAKLRNGFGISPAKGYVYGKVNDVCKPTSLHHTDLLRTLDPYTAGVNTRHCYHAPESLRSPIFAGSPPMDYNLGFPTTPRPLDPRPLDPELLRCFMYCNGSTKDPTLKTPPWINPEVPSNPHGLGWETFLSQSYDACATEHPMMRYMPQGSMGRESKDPQGIAPSRYKCGLCNASFSLQRLLNRHMKTHSFYKRYHCQFCGKGFNDTFDLKRHIRTHTGIKPFKCDRCDKSFTQRCSLEAHLTRVHSIVHKFGFRERRDKMFVCEDCGKTFKENQSEFRQHVASHHPETDKILRLRRNGFPT